VPVKESANFNHWILRAVVPRPGYRPCIALGKSQMRVPNLDGQ